MEQSFKIAAVQPNAEACYSEDAFYAKVRGLAKKAWANDADVIVFPEGINFWIDFTKEAHRVSGVYNGWGARTFVIGTGWRTWLERITNWVLQRVRLNWLGEWIAQAKIARIVQRTFSAVAQEFGVVIVAGSIYVRKKDGIHNVSYVFDRDGSLAGEAEKRYLVPIEDAWGVKAGDTIKPIQTKEYCLGVCICFDLDFPDVCRDLANQGAEVIIAPSGGWRPWPGYPFDPVKDMPQKNRAKETGLCVVRPYQCGWLAPGLFFGGHTSIVGPEGDVIDMIQDPQYETTLFTHIQRKPVLADSSQD